ncbi:MAG: hypothetical protein LUC16_02645, partial [Coprobacillus sp.]|nr:hypothetical protein [Coprobacillus sp.]
MNSKKGLFLSIIVSVGAMGALSSCLGAIEGNESDATVTSVTLNNLATYYLPTDTISWDNVTLSYTTSTKRNLTLTKAEFDTDTPSSKTEFVLYTDGLYALSTSGNVIPEDRYTISYSFTYKDVVYSDTIMSVSVTEYPSEIYSVSYYLEPEFVTTYKDNLANRVSSDPEASEDMFYEAPSYYEVGNDNSFIFKPQLTLLDLHNFTVEIPTTFAVDTKVYHNGVSLNLEANEYVSYSDFAFDFTEKAAGEVFSLEMALKFFDVDSNNNPIEPITFTFKVEDGYNAYSGLDLGVMNLHTDECNTSLYEYAQGSGASAGNHQIYWDSETNTRLNKYNHNIWTDFYKELSETNPAYADASYTKGIYMHNDIKLSMSDFPSDYIISAEEARDAASDSDDELLIGSLRDDVYIYNHLMEDDFTFNGNLFTLDCSDIRWGRTKASGQNFSYYGPNEESTEQGNSRLFMFDGNRRREASNEDGETAVLKNLNAVGNLDLEERGANFPIPTEASELSASSLRSGSVAFVDSVGTHTEVSNVIAKEFLLGFYAEKTKAGYTCLEIDHTKLFDCYAAGLFTWCSAENVIRNSTLKRFGAPVVMAMSAIDYTKYEDGNDSSVGYASGYQMSGFTVEESVIIDNYLKGDEYFFQAYGLEEVIPFIVGIDGVFHNGNIDSLLSIILESLLGGDASSLTALLSTTITDYKKTFIVDGVDGSGNPTQSFNLLYAGMDRNVFGATTDLYLDFGYAGSHIHIDSDYDPNNPAEANTDNLAYVIDQFYETEGRSNGGLSYNGLMPLFITNTGKVFTIGIELSTSFIVPKLDIYFYDVVAALNDSDDTDPSPFSGSY